MIMYIKQDAANQFVTFDSELNSSLYSNIGDTFQDYLSGMWVKLSEEQINFYNNNPNASVKEVWDMQLNPMPSEQDELEQLKRDAIKTIVLYDTSDAVNAFTINNTVKAWFTVEQRLNYKQSIEAAKLLGETNLEFLLNGFAFTITIDRAEYMLAQIQRYADKCYLITEQHKSNIKNLNTREDIISYDFTSGYPEMLNFELV